jgi:prepilin-type N-terminal cleavage/methylation domain-containing protein
MRAGVTVIELLVTVAIISILAGLLLSAVSTAKLKAQRVACRTVLRSYASEFSE